ncbi:hypothetical protein JAAARDRAFT_319481 [Jaapia argillacea MUCL 33604]|uniref:Uncharacterized protein n=1 Tax=Jaapia argillacea MUCL 33604 TaxID=933084 RepID=A0A067PMN2_9AGAM|nr:hypothetical protein JAAARDRAFT_319481 [Jaapia argillacea MUCL 33604]
MELRDRRTSNPIWDIQDPDRWRHIPLTKGQLLTILGHRTGVSHFQMFPSATTSCYGELSASEDQDKHHPINRARASISKAGKPYVSRNLREGVSLDRVSEMDGPDGALGKRKTPGLEGPRSCPRRATNVRSSDNIRLSFNGRGCIQALDR